MKALRKKQQSKLMKLTDIIRSPLSKIDFKKIVALITVEVHARNVIERMVKRGCASVDDFEWLSQLRFYWEDDCIIRQTNTTFKYGYEYLGNNGRLVITPPTDRCYMTLTTALHLRRGSPAGPAGTGKTETVKDLAKAMARCCVVFNCSDGLDYKSLGRMFSGLAQTAAEAALTSSTVSRSKCSRSLPSRFCPSSRPFPTACPSSTLRAARSA